jgi:hypothetical protein
MDYICSGRPQYKANLHCHTTLSDGHLTPEEVVAQYHDHGYSVLCITDHEYPCDHSNLSTPDFLMLTGYEAYIRPTADAKVDPFGPEIHMNLFAKDPHNTTFIAYDPNFVKYMPHELAEAQPQAGVTGPRHYNISYVNRFIRDAVASGYLVTYNHPVWSMEPESTILSYKGCFSLEIFNTSSQEISGCESNGALYDRLLRGGRRLYCHGSDDNHNARPMGDPGCDSFGSWTMILAPELTYDSVYHALENGDFYASTGPTITALHFDGKNVHLECSEAERVVMIASPKRTVRAYHPDHTPICSADFEIPDNAPYVRFSVFGANGTAAHTRAFFRDELGL